MPHVKPALEKTGHRPWPLPSEPWLMGQSWLGQLFAHWRVAPEALRRVVPPQLELDTRDGAAWLGITPFAVSGLRMRGTVPVPGFSSFPEINVRTYVVVGERPGIYFLSLDATLWAIVLGARRKYLLPYFHARIVKRDREDGWIEFSAARRSGESPPAAFEARYGPVDGRLAVHEGSLERWLTERYCLYTLDDAGTVMRGDIHHAPWELYVARAEISLNTMAEPFRLALEGAPLLHFSPRQDAVVWPLRPA